MHRVLGGAKLTRWCFFFYRDEALRQTRRLQVDIQAERETLRSLM
jgi:hypothetical protein